MARQRMIHPDFFIDENVAMLSPWARLLLISLLTQADREGRLEDRPARIHLRAFPYDRDVNLEGHLSELVEQGFILRYVADGCKYIQIRNFLKFQKPHPKEATSTIPAPPERAGELSGSAGKRQDEPANFAGVGIRNTESESDNNQTKAAAANPLVDRDAMIREGYGLIGEIAKLADLDGTEVLSKASEWKGRGRVDLASMYDNRLAHTMNALRRWLRELKGQPEPSIPARASPNGRVPTAADLTRSAVQEVLDEEAARRDRSSGVREGPGGAGAATAAVVGSGHAGRLLPRPAGGDGRRRMGSVHRARGETLPLGILPERAEDSGGAGGVPC